MNRQYRVERAKPNSDWYYGFVRFQKKSRFGARWSEWHHVCSGSQDRKEIERAIDKYESEQPDHYFYTPKAPT